MEITVTIAPEGFVDSHPELHHYTTFEGFKGIIESNSLWATHFAHLNDAKEIVLLKESLASAISRRAETNLNAGLNRTLRRSLEKKGGLPKLAGDLIESLYSAAFTGGHVIPMAEPYITSFCTHCSTPLSYEKDHGLLSQWRGYGKNGGYCIVFNSAALLKLLVREYDSYYWIGLHPDAVRYVLPNLTVEVHIETFLKLLDDVFAKALRGGPIEISADTLVEFLHVAPFFKHQGFKEEQEVRIVSIPGTEHTVERMKAEKQDFQPLPLKKIYYRDSNRGQIPYVALFENLKEQLPIKRVIVGPSEHQDENYELAKSLVGSDVKVDRSETPFIG